MSAATATLTPDSYTAGTATAAPSAGEYLVFLYLPTGTSGDCTNVGVYMTPASGDQLTTFTPDTSSTAANSCDFVDITITPVA